MWWCFVWSTTRILADMLKHMLALQCGVWAEAQALVLAQASVIDNGFGVTISYRSTVLVSSTDDHVKMVMAQVATGVAMVPALCARLQVAGPTVGMIAGLSGCVKNFTRTAPTRCSHVWCLFATFPSAL